LWYPSTFRPKGELKVPLQILGEIMVTPDIDEAVVESIRQELQRKTGKQVERVDGAHNRLFGPSAIFRVSPVGDAHIFVVFRPGLCRQGSSASGLVKEVAETIEALIATEPQVIEVDEKGVHQARPLRSYRITTT
jgi:hypothetical protein